VVVPDDGHVIGENPAETGIDEPGGAILVRGRFCRELDFKFQFHSLHPAAGTGSPAQWV
jgi:hypothetical protein